MSPKIGFFLLAIALSLTAQVRTDGIQFLSPLQELNIFYAAPSGIQVGRVTAFDAYNPLYRLTFSIEDGFDGKYFIVNNASGDITTQRYIDRKVGSLYHFTVAAFGKEHSSSLKVTVRVTTYNAYPPVFEKSNYTLVLHAHIEVGNMLTTVVAKDEDTDSFNSKVYYKINGTDIISIESETGVIKLAKPLPLLLRNFTAIIRAEDRGSPQRGSEAIVNVLFPTSGNASNENCPAEKIRNSRGIFYWNTTEVRQISKVLCPFGISDTNVAILKHLENLQNDNDTINYDLAIKEREIDHYMYQIKKIIELEESNNSIHLPQKDKYQFLRNHSSMQNVLSLLKSGILLDPSGNAFAVRRCAVDTDGRPKWETPIISLCKEEGLSDAEKNMQEFEIITRNSSSIDYDIYSQAIKRVEKILPYSLIDQNLAHRMLNGISTIMNIDDSILEEKDVNGSISTLYLKVIEDYSKHAVIFPKNQISFNFPNLALEILDVEPSKILAEEISYSVQDMDAKNDTSEIQTDDTANQGISMKIHSQALNLDPNQKESLRIQFGCFHNSKLFRKFTSNNSSSHSSSTHIYQKVVTASISDLFVTNTTNVLEYTVPYIKKNIKYTCIYWDPKSQSWLSDGLRTNQTDNFIVCHSTHMTAFSVLFDLNPEERISETHKNILNVISYLGSILSLIGLALTITTYGLFRCLIHDHSGKILLNLCISLFFMNLSFLMGSFKQYILIVDICTVVALLVHYFVLSSLCWMFVEAFHMYQLLITVFATAETKFIIKRLCFAWGIPLLIVISTLTIDSHFYETDENDFCLLSFKKPYLYYSLYLGPCCIILVINLIIFLLVSRVLFQNHHIGKVNSKKDSRIHMTQVRGAFTVMTLLGVTWIFGAIAVGELRLIFQYLFCISNSLQGFIIFIVRCYNYPEAKAAWITLIKTGKLKKHQGFSRSFATNSATHSSTTNSSGPYLHRPHTFT